MSTADLTAAIARYTRLNPSSGGQSSRSPGESDTSFQQVLARASETMGSAASATNPAASGANADAVKATTRVATVDPADDPRFSTTRKVIPMSAEERAAAKAAQAEATYKAAQEALVEWSQKSYVEKLREIIIEEMGLTEEEIAAMPPDKREAIEHEIARRIKERLGQLDQKADEASLAGRRYANVRGDADNMLNTVKGASGREGLGQALPVVAPDKA